MRRLPAAALLLGLAGLLPFLACAYGALSTRDVVDANYWLLALCGYGAVILSFLGGVHWGFVLGAVRPGASSTDASSADVSSADVSSTDMPSTGGALAPVRTRYRLVLGVLPALGGWAAILVMFAGQVVVALVILIAGFVLFAGAESELRQRGLVPPGYLLMRWGLTLVVVLVLGAVVAMRVLGGRISF